MPIGVSSEHRELAASLGDWAAGLHGLDAARAAEGQPGATFDEVWTKVVDQGVATIVLPEEVGGGGGSVLDAAVAVEACAVSLLPGHLFSAAVAACLATTSPAVARSLADGARAAVALDAALSVTSASSTPKGASSAAKGASSAEGWLRGTVPVVLDAPGADLFVLGGRDEAGREDAGQDGGGRERWFFVPADRVTVEPAEGLDLTRRAGSVTVDVPIADLVEIATDEASVRRLAITFAAAEASGVAQWCLRTAVAYALVREQFGQPIGRFQAIKQLCAEMLETAEAVSGVAWDVASAASGESDAEQWAFAADVAGTVALDGAVKTAQTCIQILGGTGFTFEHEAHFYLRRAMALRALLGSGDRHAKSLASKAVGGVRRRVEIDLDGRDDAVRTTVRDEVAAVATLPADQQRRALAERGLITPHWPAPYGRDAGAVEQIVIEQELAAVGVTPPDLKIGGWAVPTILSHGTDAQRERFARPTLDGDLIWCQLFSEPGAGSDLASLRTRAVRVDGGWKLTGQKVWTSLAQNADWGICLARTNPDVAQHAGITYFLVDMKSPGIDIRPLREMTGDAMFNEVFLDDVFVPDDLVVGEVDGGWRLARTTLANERVAMAGTKLGLSAERAVALVAEDADLARVGHAVALSTVCGLLDVRTTLRSIEGQGPGPESSVAKLLTVRARQEASELVVDLLGPRALSADAEVRADLHEMLLTRCLSIAGGTTQILRNVAAERILGLPR